MKNFTSDRLVTQVRLEGSLATGDFTDQEILDVATECAQSKIAPLLIDLKNDYFVRHALYAITQGQASYPFHSRAAGMILKDIRKIMSTGEVKDLTHIDPAATDTTNQGEPSYFYEEDNSIIVYPTPQTTQHSLKMSYFMRHPYLVPLSECGRIDTIDPVTKIITGTFPSTWTTSDTFDLIKGKNGYETRDIDLSASSVTTSSITLSASLPESLVVGDYIALAEESCFPAVPQDCHALLVWMTVKQILKAKGDREGAAAATEEITELTGYLTKLMKERVQGRPERMSSPLL